MVVRKPTYKKWWLDFQGNYKSDWHYLELLGVTPSKIVWVYNGGRKPGLKPYTPQKPNISPAKMLLGRRFFLLKWSIIR